VIPGLSEPNKCRGRTSKKKRSKRGVMVIWVKKTEEGGYHKIMDNKTVPIGTGPRLIGANNMAIVNV
jgi:hypothetical protein